MNFFKNKYTAIQLMIVCTLFSNVAFAKDSKNNADSDQQKKAEKTAPVVQPKKNYSVMANPIGLLYGVGDATFNFGVADNMTLGAGLLFVGRNSLGGYGLSGRMNYYVTGLRFEDGLYISPKVDFITISAHSVTVSGIGFAGLVGYNWLYKSGFTMMAGGGIQHHIISASVGGANLGSMSGTGLAAEFNIGYAW